MLIESIVTGCMDVYIGYLGHCRSSGCRVSCYNARIHLKAVDFSTWGVHSCNQEKHSEGIMDTSFPEGLTPKECAFLAADLCNTGVQALSTRFNSGHWGKGKRRVSAQLALAWGLASFHIVAGGGI